jgi:hypothetical protein
MPRRSSCCDAVLWAACSRLFSSPASDMKPPAPVVDIVSWEVLQLCSHPVVGWPDAPPGIFGLWSIQVAAISTGGNSPGRGLVSALFTFVPRRRGVARRAGRARRITSRCGDGSKRYAPELRRCLRRTFGRDPTGERAEDAEQFGGFLLGSGIKCKSFCNAIAQYAVPSRSDLTANDIRVEQRHRFNLPHDPAFGVRLRFGV